MDAGARLRPEEGIVRRAWPWAAVTVGLTAVLLLGSVRWGALAVAAAALVAHEGSHAVGLRLADVDVRPAVRWQGIGWRFEPGHAPVASLLRAWELGPMVETVVWLLGALLLPAMAFWLLVLAAVQLGANWLIPGGDGSRVRRWRRRLSPG
ncbi:MAG TPA: hypothetical protein VNN74_02175 [Candidatus Micrarchaeia archaeon]|nr:hypothetical protein [Candidatus Micrarchaeia archaeon]